MYDDDVVFQTAAITKLTRNIFLAGVVPGLSWSKYREEVSAAEASAAESESSKKDEKVTAISGLATFQKFVPPFLMAFVGMATLRSIGDMTLDSDSSLAFGVLDPSTYKMMISLLGDDLSKACLGTAMAAVGLSTDFSSLRGVGVKPFLVGGSGAFVVAGTGLAVSSIVM
jgi:uncharacterized membrane protein YadS